MITTSPTTPLPTSVHGQLVYVQVLANNTPPAGTHINNYEISIAGLDKAMLLAEFFNNTVTKFEEATSQALSLPLPFITADQTRPYLDANGDFSVSKLFGRQLNIKTDGHVLHHFFYDQLHGHGNAASIVRHIIKRQFPQ